MGFFFFSCQACCCFRDYRSVYWCLGLLRLQLWQSQDLVMDGGCVGRGLDGMTFRPAFPAEEMGL